MSPVTLDTNRGVLRLAGQCDEIEKRDGKSPACCDVFGCDEVAEWKSFATAPYRRDFKSLVVVCTDHVRTTWIGQESR